MCRSNNDGSSSDGGGSSGGGGSGGGDDGGGRCLEYRLGNALGLILEFRREISTVDLPGSQALILGPLPRSLFLFHP